MAFPNEDQEILENIKGSYRDQCDCVEKWVVQPGSTACSESLMSVVSVCRYRIFITTTESNDYKLLIPRFPHSLRMPVCIFIRLSFSDFPLSLFSISVCLSVYLFLSLCFHLSISTSPSVSLSLSLCISNCLQLSLSSNLPAFV